MSKKGEHPLLVRLIRIADLRLSFADQVVRCKRQHQWVIELERLLDGPSEGRSAQQVKDSVDAYLCQLMTQPLDPVDLAVATHINQTIRNLWWGLFTCYDVPNLPRTNNGLERHMRWVKTAQRRITGRKNVHDALIRFGEFIAYLDATESLADLLERLPSVTHEAFLAERHLLDTSLLHEAKHQRFRLRRSKFLLQLEEQWAETVANITL